MVDLQCCKGSWQRNSQPGKLQWCIASHYPAYRYPPSCQRRRHSGMPEDPKTIVVSVEIQIDISVSTYLGEESQASKGQDHKVQLSEQSLLLLGSILFVPHPFVVPFWLAACLKDS